MAMSDTALEKGMAAAQKAVTADNEGNLAQAQKHYVEAIDLFFIHNNKFEKNPRSKEVIRGKIKEYIDRAEQIKKHLGEKENGNGAAANGATDEDSKKLRNALAGAILTNKPNIHWEDIAGLEGAKSALKEAVILPIKFPHLFTGKRQPWKGILLYGPPGTGKSYLAKAVATEANGTFFSVSSSDLVSKWMGESERLVKSLFAMARENTPAIIFIDEIDALCGPRGEGESEASRRIKTEMLVQMDGVGKDSKGVLILGATNIPWQLDAAIRRRFQRRVHISLPDLPARVKMFELNVGATPCQLNKEDYQALGRVSEGYSGSDIAICVQDALMQPVRLIQTATHWRKVTVTEDVDGTPQQVEKWTPCSPGAEGAVEMDWMQVEAEKLLEPPLTRSAFEKAVKTMRPTVNKADLEKNAQWTEDFGSEGS